MQIQNLRKVYEKRAVIEDISLSFYHGAKIGVLGGNGAGKSTLLRIMAGQDKDVDGTVWWNPGTKIGYVSQEPPLDVVDGAARILDPLYSGLVSGVHASGIFFKDYRPASW